MANDLEFPLPTLTTLYHTLAQRGIGLIITGHMYINQAENKGEEIF